jgi:WD40 repeat protein
MDSAYGGSPLLAAGSNSHCLTLLDGLQHASAAEADVDTGLAALPVVHQWQGHHLGSVFCIAWAPPEVTAGSTALLATGSNDTTVRVVAWPAVAQLPSALTLQTEAGTVRDVCWVSAPAAPLRLAAGGGGDFSVRVWDMQAAQWRGAIQPASAPAKLAGHSDVVHGVREFSDDGHTLASCSADGTVRLWDLRARQAVGVFCVNAAAGSATRSLVPAGAILPNRPVPGGVPLHALSVRRGPSNHVVVGGADGTVAVLDVAAGRMFASARLHTDEVRCVDALGPLVLSASFDGTVAVSCLMGNSDGAPMLKLLNARRDHRDRVLCARWYAHAPLVATTSADKSVLLWRVAANE